MSYPSNYVTRQQLERLHKLLQAKLQKLAAAPVQDSDSELSTEILKFVDFLVGRQISIAEQETLYTGANHQHSAAAPKYWSTHTGTVMPYGKPSTICDNCWQKSNGTHTHCTHNMLDE